MRHFLTPGGGRWTASLCKLTRCSFGVGSSIVISGSVLRFASACGVTFDLEDWPADWMNIDDAGMIALLQIAATTGPSAYEAIAS